MNCNKSELNESGLHVIDMLNHEILIDNQILLIFL